MRKLISLYIILCSSFALLPLRAQDVDRKVEKTVEALKPKPRFYQGIEVSADLYGPVHSLLTRDERRAEASVKVNLLNRFLPVVEVGYSHYATTHDDTHIHYTARAPYFKAGLDYNFFHKKSHLPGYLYGGLRYGYSKFRYDLTSPPLADLYWNHPPIALSEAAVPSTAGWAELLAGIDVRLYKSLRLGWTVRYLRTLHVSGGAYSSPYFIPGFGKNDTSHLSFTYTLSYKLPF